MDSVYIETSVISHATALPSRVPATAVLQDQAKAWLSQEINNYDVVTSQLVIDEAGRGNPEAAARRLALLSEIPLLPVYADTEYVADQIISGSIMPAKARLDALHVATAALAGVQYLLTQNCTHIANAHELPRVYRLLDTLGLSGMLICTPANFLGDADDQ